jgi:glycosyltransferase involved in cell wall biosynthesis
VTAPRVSIVTPAYNPANLSTAAEAVASQSLPDIEWIVVDDGSDAAFAPAFEAAIAAAVVPVTLVRLPVNKGQAEARNIGVRTARGTSVKFLDADDSLDPNHLHHLVEARQAIAGRPIVPFAPTRHVYAATGIARTNLTYRHAGSDCETQLARLLVSPFLHHGGALWPRDLLLRLGPYDPDLATDEDGDLLIRALREGYVYRPVPACHYMYRHGGTQARVSCDDSVAKLASRRRVCQKLADSYIAAGEAMPDRIKDALCKRIDRIAVAAWDMDRPFSLSTLAFATAIKPGYTASGRRAERLVRQVFGTGAARHAARLFRGVRRVAAGPRP